MTSRSRMRFFGIDLAFSSKNPSGLCVLDERGELMNADYLRSDEEIVGFIEQEADPIGNVIVVDAPLICVNETGQRPCEKLVGRLYGKYHASCHSSNIRNMAGQRGPMLVSAVQERFPVTVQHDARNTSADMWPMIETYPHPAHIELFKLSRIFKYKKGRVGDKREGLMQYTTALKELQSQKPPLQIGTIPFLDQDIYSLKGKGLKRQEDLLDAVFCAYTAAHLWHHRRDTSCWRTIKTDSSPDFITVPLLSQ